MSIVPIEAKLPLVVASLALLVFPLLSGAQTSKATLDRYLAQGVAEGDALNSETISEWAVRHPGEKVEEPAAKADFGSVGELSVRQREDLKLEGRWCLRSTAEIDLAGGVHVRRIALFYQPLINDAYMKPLPPLPTETGDALRNQGCRLVRILHEFEGVAEPQDFVETVAQQLPGKRLEEPGRFIEFARDNYWKPVCSFERFGHPIAYHHLFVRNPKVAQPDDRPAALLEWQWGTLDYGPPPSTRIDPEAGQPWLAMRAARLAQLPPAPTLAMLSFLAPQAGDRWEQPPFHCHRELIPVLRAWFGLAAQGSPERQAAAILLADRVLYRLSDCEEFDDSGSSVSPEDEAIEAKDNDGLQKELEEFGIQTETGRLGNVNYAGNLLNRVFTLAPERVVNELAHMAVLDGRCRWDFNADAVDCAAIIKEGEGFLQRFPADEWTSTVHLILAEAYSLTAINPVEDYAPAPELSKAEAEKKAATHYRAWYAKSTNHRDRALVWQEIWALEAGMGPWLMIPSQSQR
jgi:hypothetical protein